jgi:hypothetical protein
MRKYESPEVERKLFQHAPFFSQYELIPDCSSDLIDQCTPGGGVTGYICSNDTLQVIALVYGSTDTQSFPCKLLVNDSTSSFNLIHVQAVICNGVAGVAYFLETSISCTSISSVQIECETTANCTLLNT